MKFIEKEIVGIDGERFNSDHRGMDFDCGGVWDSLSGGDEGTEFETL